VVGFLVACDVKGQGVRRDDASDCGALGASETGEWGVGFVCEMRGLIRETDKLRMGCACEGTALIFEDSVR
jgi:hypothetical protein